jgi:murein DD-endopeptidase MepM/ murein hydrolase activator NlpD
MGYTKPMDVTNRKKPEQQAQLIFRDAINATTSHRLLHMYILPVTLLFCLISTLASADIYRFVTIDGVETFTDAPSDKSATIVIKDHNGTATKKRGTAKKQKTHDISLDEIVQKAVTASLNPPEADQTNVELHLPPVGGTITSRVGMRVDPVDGTWRLHNGIDIAIATGTPVRPVAAGVVVYSGSRSGYGNTVVVEHDNGIISLYAHNSRLQVSTGQQVTQESTLALSGSTGRSTGPHLHFEAWQAGTNVTMAFLAGSGVTLPKTTLVANNQRAQRFRSETLSDGSILFTNIPSSTP